MKLREHSAGEGCSLSVGREVLVVFVGWGRCGFIGWDRDGFVGTSLTAGEHEEL